jgi:hypothetical protein
MRTLTFSFNGGECRNPTLGLSVRMQLTLPKVGKWSPLGLPKTQKTIWGIKSPHLGAFFISIESFWNVDVQNGLALPIWTSTAQVMGKQRVGSQTASLTFDSRPLKVRNRLLFDVASRNATWSWKALDKSYNFGSKFVPIRVWGEELWSSKVPGL